MDSNSRPGSSISIAVAKRNFVAPSPTIDVEFDHLGYSNGTADPGRTSRVT